MIGTKSRTERSSRAGRTLSVRRGVIVGEGSMEYVKLVWEEDIYEGRGSVGFISGFQD
jgi:hypothetical protein